MQTIRLLIALLATLAGGLALIVCGASSASFLLAVMLREPAGLALIAAVTSASVAFLAALAVKWAAMDYDTLRELRNFFRPMGGL